MKIAVFPGSFDPVTLGHLDIVARAAKLFDRVYICTMVNAEKRGMFTAEERLELLRGSVAHLDNVEAELWSGLLVDYAREKGARFLVKGVRNGSDFDLEYSLARINTSIEPELETVLLCAD
ncbi:MAG: pantetheine-phosphate adenylyltransferase, partial [Oscillospiraceae bacterium]|nr:pantetheine-phosphate adenylyltransferase [Oscillospiraceae bacterium]